MSDFLAGTAAERDRQFNCRDRLKMAAVLVGEPVLIDLAISQLLARLARRRQ